MTIDTEPNEPVSIDPTQGRLLVLFHDLDGRPVERDVWAALNGEARLRLARVERFGVRVETEWIGINHNGDPDGPAWIYETVVRVAGRHAFSVWTSNRKGAIAAQLITVVRAALYGFAWWPLRRSLSRWLLRRRLARGQL